jgi:hypothetical protein
MDVNQITDQKITQVRNNNREWVGAATGLLRRLLEQQQYVTADDFWSALKAAEATLSAEEGHRINLLPENNSALGAVMQDAVTYGWMEPAFCSHCQQTIKARSTRKERRGWMTKWKSHLYQPSDTLGL